MNKIKNALVLTVVLAAAVWAWGPARVNNTPSTHALNYHGQLTVKPGDNKITNQHGEPVVLRGMSLFWDCWASSYYNANVVKTLAEDWKGTVIRAAYGGSGNEPNCSGGGSETSLTTVVDAAKANGIYAIIDWHSHSAHNGANGEREKALAFFSKMAQKYKGEKHVLYEIYNEPCKVGTNSACTGDDWATIKSYMQAAVDTIRRHDPHNVILIGTPDFSKDVDKATESPVTGSNLAYVVHFYAAQEGHKNTLRSQVRTALGRPNGYPVFISEFGVTEANGGGKLDFAETEKWFDEISDNRYVGWANWSLFNKDESSAALMSSANSTGPWQESQMKESGRWIYDKLRWYGTEISGITGQAATPGAGVVTITTPFTELNKNGRYFPGQVLTFTATQQAGSDVPFANWEITGTGTYSTGPGQTLQDNPLNLRLTSTAPITVKAVFAKKLLLHNGTFDANVDGWAVGVTGSGAGASRTYVSGECKVGATNYGTARTHVRFEQGGVSLTQGRKYLLSFKARAVSGSRSITPTLRSGSTFHNRDTSSVQLTSAMTAFRDTFDMRDPSTTNASVIFYYGNESGEWIIDDIVLEDIGAANSSSIFNVSAAARPSVWSAAVIAGGGVQLRGPADAGAKVALYDVRGRMVRSVAANDGMILGRSSGIPSGNYLMVVKNAAGKEVLKSRVLMAW